eukprot:gene6721-5603_t
MVSYIVTGAAGVGKSWLLRRAAATRGGEESLTRHFLHFRQERLRQGIRESADSSLVQWIDSRLRRGTLTLDTAADYLQKVERGMAALGQPVRSELTRQHGQTLRRIGSFAPSRTPASAPAAVGDGTRLLVTLRRRRDPQAAAMVAAMWGLACRASDLRLLVPADCVRVDEGGGAVAWELDLHEKPSMAAAGKRRPPQVLAAGPLADVFAEWLAV